jgi:ribonuclease P protein component
LFIDDDVIRMMPAHLRLRHSQDFARLRHSGQAQRHPLLLLSYAPNARDHNRYGFVIGKAVGGAVVRNHLRRQLRALMAALHPRLRQGHDCVWIARPALVQQPFDELQRIIEALCQRAKLLEVSR